MPYTDEQKTRITARPFEHWTDEEIDAFQRAVRVLNAADSAFAPTLEEVGDLAAREAADRTYKLMLR